MVWNRKTQLIIDYFNLIVNSDIVLVANYTKRGIDGYIGANTLMEIGMALYHNKLIYLMNDVPDMQYKEEILACNPIILKGDLNKIVS